MDQPKNLEEAVLVELEKKDIFPIINVTGQLMYITKWSDEQLKSEVLKALNTLRTAGVYEQSTGISRGVAEFIKGKNQKSEGKKV